MWPGGKDIKVIVMPPKFCSSQFHFFSAWKIGWKRGTVSYWIASYENDILDLLAYDL